jgi:hypothetical protein
VVPKEKLYDYALNPDHPQGKYKARVFKSMLGIEREHADVLAEIIIATLPRAVARQNSANEFGESWVTYHDVVGLNGNTAILTVPWILLKWDPDKPRLVSCYIEVDNQERLAELLRLA